MITELEQAGVLVPKIDLVATGKAVMKIAADSEASHDLRVSAFHTCCDRKLHGVLKDARRVAGDKNETTVVRKAAIFAIGKMGTKHDLKMLTALLLESDLMSEAARPAIERIKE